MLPHGMSLELGIDPRVNAETGSMFRGRERAGGSHRDVVTLPVVAQFQCLVANKFGGRSLGTRPFPGRFRRGNLAA